tara:strand:- start:2511 stop:4031 length:1521 start_codon:yes stop_codon:yes gene_type:complete
MPDKKVHLDALRHIQSISQKLSDDVKEEKRKLSEKELVSKFKSDTLEELNKFKEEFTTKHAEDMKDFGKKLQKSVRDDHTSVFEYDSTDGKDVIEGDGTLRQKMQKMVDTPSDRFSGQEGLAVELQRHNDTLLMLSHVMKRAPQELKYYDTHIRKNSELEKALSPDGASSAGRGAEWVPEAFSSDFINRMEQKYELAGSIPKITIPQGVDSLKIPGAGAGISLQQVNATAADTANSIPQQTPGSRNITLTPKKLAIMVQIEEEAVEDMIVNVIQDITIPEMQNAAAKGVDNAIINGNGESINIVGASGAGDDTSTYNEATDPRGCWDGLRRFALDEAYAGSIYDMSGGALTIAGIASAAGLLAGGSDNENFFDPPNNRLVVPLAVYLDLLTMSNVIQADQIGSAAAATINSGQLASVLGIPIIQTQLLAPSLATGLLDGTATNNVKNNAVIFNRNAFIMGIKRDVTVKSRENIETDRRHVVLTFRAIFASRYANTAKSVAQIINIS